MPKPTNHTNEFYRRHEAADKEITQLKTRLESLDGGMDSVNEAMKRIEAAMLGNLDGKPGVLASMATHKQDNEAQMRAMATQLSDMKKFLDLMDTTQKKHAEAQEKTDKRVLVLAAGGSGAVWAIKFFLDWAGFFGKH